jgi:Replication-relaxation
MSSSTSRTRRGRVTADRLTELPNHLTDRDREIALALYEHRILTSSQLTLLFFSGRRRAMDRLLFLYRQRVLDRFYPPRPFAYGKPQAHWLLDEAGARIVAACLSIDRRALPWRQRENWGTHPQLAHRLEINTFVTDLIAVTLPHPALGVVEWRGSGSVKEQMPDGVALVPDAGFLVSTPAGLVDCVLEWDRGTEPGSVLEHKLRMYSKAAGRSNFRCCVLFVVPGARRTRTLEETMAHAGFASQYGEAWPVFVATVLELREFGPLGPIWQPLGERRSAPLRIEALPVSDLEPLDPGDALGRRWRKDRPGFWHALSPLGAPAPAEEEWR